jgi:twitching motility two-component system response regulator PilH
MPIQKILVVDDSPTERYFYADLLTRSGYTVLTAENGEEALAKAKHDLPQLILMDVVMPGQNGFQVTRAISRDPVTAHIPIIICTSKDQETDRFWGMKQGAKDYLIKPVDPKELLQKIQAIAV